MPPEVVDSSAFSPDIQDFLRVLDAHHVRFMIVGGEAVIFYGHIRVTGDIDVYYDREHDNAVSLFKALEDFWQGEIPELGGPWALQHKCKAAYPSGGWVSRIGVYP